MSDEYDDATALAEDEKEGLIPSYISTRGELNQAEQQNIVQGELWAFAKKRNPLDLSFLDTLHKKNVWRGLEVGWTLSQNGPKYQHRCLPDSHGIKAAH